MKTFFFLILTFLSLAGALTNGIHLIQQIYLWPLVRLVGYLSLFVYALLMLRGTRYNTRTL